MAFHDPIDAVSAFPASQHDIQPPVAQNLSHPAFPKHKMLRPTLWEPGLAGLYHTQKFQSAQLRQTSVPGDS